eukprot:12566593-Alexandrium_andersonii.AAC.1
MDANDPEVHNLHMFTCPMSSMRAPAMAMGRHLALYHDIAALAEAAFLCNACAHLSAPGRAVAMQNFAVARGELQDVLAAKTDFWLRLPWATA